MGERKISQSCKHQLSNNIFAMRHSIILQTFAGVAIRIIANNKNSSLSRTANTENGINRLFADHFFSRENISELVLGLYRMSRHNVCSRLKRSFYLRKKVRNEEYDLLSRAHN